MKRHLTLLIAALMIFSVMLCSCAAEAELEPQTLTVESAIQKEAQLKAEGYFTSEDTPELIRLTCGNREFGYYMDYYEIDFSTGNVYTANNYEYAEGKADNPIEDDELEPELFKTFTPQELSECQGLFRAACLDKWGQISYDIADYEPLCVDGLWVIDAQFADGSKQHLYGCGVTPAMADEFDKALAAATDAIGRIYW